MAEPTTILAPVAGERVEIRHPSGAVVLELEVSATSFRVALSVLGELSIACKQFSVHAREGIALSTNGDLRGSIAGDVELRCGGELDAAADAVRLRARGGEVRIEANDDVRVRGERILLND